MGSPMVIMGARRVTADRLYTYCAARLQDVLLGSTIRLNTYCAARRAASRCRLSSSRTAVFYVKLGAAVTYSNGDKLKIHVASTDPMKHMARP